MAVSFPGGSNYLQTANNFVELNVATICMWWTPNSVSGNNRIIGSDTDWEGRLSGTTLLHEFRTGNVPTITFTAVAGTEYHIAFTFDGTNKGAYINAVANPPPTAITHGATGTTNPLSIGSSSWNAGQGMNGILEDVRIYNRVLSQKEVEQIFNGNGQDRLTNGLQHWWLLNNGPEGGTVSLEPDLVSKVNLSTIVGSPTYVRSPRRYI